MPCKKEVPMEEQIITITVKTKGDVCVMSDEEIREWYATNVAKLFNPEYGTPEITVDVKRIVKE
jgi:hypothetical protein